ncbi:hypothetical protein ACFPN7_25900 [Amycolatopsis halotolerans]|uniref:hypothetical protein n=1 Tax=Amycolatopsis halotolerans TaxID=330083 RepID=UPI0036240987
MPAKGRLGLLGAEPPAGLPRREPGFRVLGRAATQRGQAPVRTSRPNVAYRLNRLIPVVHEVGPAGLPPQPGHGTDDRRGIETLDVGIAPPP